MSPSRFAWTFALVAAFSALDAGAQDAAPVQCDDRTGPYLSRGWFLLHSFDYEGARREFMTASAIDGECALAHAGEALSFFPLLEEPASKDDVVLGAEAIARAQAAPRGTDRDRAFVDAVEPLFTRHESVPRRNRIIAFHNALQRLHFVYRGEVELAAFYGLSLLALDPAGESPETDRRREAAKILEPYFKGYPEHPGIALYLAHSYDATPETARGGLEAAARIAALAPDVPHAWYAAARIYVRLGMWHEALAATLASDRASLAQLERLGLPPERRYLPNVECKLYVLLQVGRIAEARRLLDEIGKLVEDTDSPSVLATYTEMRYRFLLDGRQWAEAVDAKPVTDEQRETIQLQHARTLAGALGGDLEAAKGGARALKNYGAKVVERFQGEAVLAMVENDLLKVGEIMKRQAWSEDQLRLPAFLPIPALPARELYGEMLLRLGEPRQAAEQFALVQARYAKRPAAILGLARSAAGLAQWDEARARLAEALAILSGADQDAPLVREAAALNEAMQAAEAAEPPAAAGVNRSSSFPPT